MEYLKRLRVNKGISQEQFAEIVGVDQASVSLYECGKRKPSAKTIGKIAKAFDLSVEEVFRAVEGNSDEA